MAQNSQDIEIPKDKRKLRACMLCSLVKTQDQFKRNGCNNCSLLQINQSLERFNDCTSGTFEGLIAMQKPENSWVAKWQRINRFQPGVYAVKVVGQLPQYIIDELEQSGIKYRPRDGSVVD